MKLKTENETHDKVPHNCYILIWPKLLYIQKESLNFYYLF